MCDFNHNLIEVETYKFLDAMQDNVYKQLITQPTRITHSTRTLLDHIYTNKSNNVSGFGAFDYSFSDQ